MNVSERMVHMAGELMRTGREDLVRAVEAGTLTTHGALKIAKPEKYKKTPSDRLASVKALCRRMSREEYQELLGWLSCGAPDDDK